MKRLIITILTMLVLCFAETSAQNIAYVRQINGYYHLYDSRGRDIRQISIDKTTLIGYSEKLIIVQKNGYYIIYNSSGKKLSTLDADMIGKITNVLTDGFISERKGFTYRWNSNGTERTIIK